MQDTFARARDDRVSCIQGHIMNYVNFYVGIMVTRVRAFRVSSRLGVGLVLNLLI